MGLREKQVQRKAAKEVAEAERMQERNSRREARALEIEGYSVDELRHLAALAIANGEKQHLIASQELDYSKASALVSLAILQQLTEGQATSPGTDQLPV